MKLCKLITNWKHGVVYIRDNGYLGETQILSLSSYLILVQEYGRF